MNPGLSKNRHRGGFDIFDMLCFVAACGLAFYLALSLIHHSGGRHGTAIFFICMLIVYPAVGFVFATLLRLLFRYLHRKSNPYNYRNDE